MNNKNVYLIYIIYIINLHKNILTTINKYTNYFIKIQYIIYS